MSDDGHDLRFAPIWRATAKIVFSRTLPTADWGARVVSENHRRGTHRALEQPGKHLSLASDTAMRARPKSHESVSAIRTTSVRATVGRVHVKANGELVELTDGATVDDLLAQLGLGRRWVLVERNGEPVNRRDVTTTTLADGDRLELVRAVAGG